MAREQTAGPRSGEEGEPAMARVLIIDSDEPFRAKLTKSVRQRGFETCDCATMPQAMRRLETEAWDVVLLADNLSQGDIISNLGRITNCGSAPEVVVMAGQGSQDLAEQAIRAGAWNYFTKPPSLHRLAVVIERIAGYRSAAPLTRTVALKRGEIIGNSKPLQAALDQVAQAAISEANVLITGETGTGKELFARAVHENSPRSDRAFVVVDCAALPSTLAESVLFGHEKGAFTSADAKAEGLVRQAHGGTLFLDEVGELPMSVQKVFLRVIETRRYRAVGATREDISDFRLVAATNRDLEAMVAKDRFRSDLLFRLQGFSLLLPPLKIIADDINELTCNYIGSICHRLSLPRKGFSPDFLEALMQYHWPGNVRELFHAIDQAVSMAGNEAILYPRHLPTHIRAQMARAGVEHRHAHKDEPPKQARYKADQELPDIRQGRAEALAHFEKQYLKELLHRTGGNMRKACTISGLSRARIYALMKHYDLSRPSA